MKQTKAPKLTPSPSSTKQSKAVADKGSPSQVFISMVLDMSWRLALVFLIPVIAGVELDKHYHPSGDIYLIIGLILGVAGAIMVIYRTYKLANQLAAEDLKGQKRGK